MEGCVQRSVIRLVRCGGRGKGWSTGMITMEVKGISQREARREGQRWYIALSPSSDGARVSGCRHEQKRNSSRRVGRHKDFTSAVVSIGDQYIHRLDGVCRRCSRGKDGGKGCTSTTRMKNRKKNTTASHTEKKLFVQHPKPMR
jgi:hypothetical protein